VPFAASVGTNEIVMAQHRHGYIPAAGHDWLLPFYDPFNWLLGGDALRRPLIEQASIQPGQRILDIGCGTGALTILLKRLHHDADVVGLDPDPKALEIARRKSRRADLPIEFVVGFADRLDYPDAAFDRVFSSLMLHHLDRDQKLATLREVRRVLKDAGTLHVLDFGPPRSALARAFGPLLHNAGHVKDNVDGRIPSFMTESGFVSAEEVGHRNTVIGSIAYYRAAPR
jgi:SAM-dependent methyltransferase